MPEELPTPESGVKQVAKMKVKNKEVDK